MREQGLLAAAGPLLSYPLGLIPLRGQRCKPRTYTQLHPWGSLLPGYLIMGSPSLGLVPFWALPPSPACILIEIPGAMVMMWEDRQGLVMG